MQLYLWLVACIVSLITSISVSTTLFLNVLEIGLLILGQLITSWDLFCRGMTLWRLSINLFAIIVLSCMSINPTPTDPNDPVNLFILLPIAYLLVAILLVDKSKHVRKLFTHTTSTSDETDSPIEFRQLPYYCPHLFTLYDQYSDESFNTWHLVQLHGALLHGDGDESVTESDSDESVDSLSTITEEEVQDNMEELLAPHLEELLGEIFPPHLPPLALPG